MSPDNNVEKRTYHQHPGRELSRPTGNYKDAIKSLTAGGVAMAAKNINSQGGVENYAGLLLLGLHTAKVVQDTEHSQAIIKPSKRSDRIKETVRDIQNLLLASAMTVSPGLVVEMLKQHDASAVKLAIVGLGLIGIFDVIKTVREKRSVKKDYKLKIESRNKKDEFKPVELENLAMYLSHESDSREQGELSSQNRINASNEKPDPKREADINRKISALENYAEIKVNRVRRRFPSRKKDKNSTSSQEH